ncbi:hypothetical protein [Thermomonas sp.]|uniref:hypothetical protein n=1 Tax=Thermomonas sp. TaxID=1971895 RepID=UPI00391B0C76
MAKKSAADQPQPEPKRGAKPLATVALQGDVMDPDKLAARHGELVVMTAQQQALVDEFGDGLPWHPDHYEAAIRGELRRGCDAFLRAGRYLIVARECAVHGEWAGILGRLGMEPRQAQRMMEAARRVCALPNASRATHLVEAAGTQSKLIELLSLPEDQFAELAEKGATGDLELDELADMTRDELRAAVREARADIDAKDQRIGKLSEDLNRAEEKAAKAQRKWKSGTPDDQQVVLEQRIVEAKHAIIANIGSEKSGLVSAVLELANHCNEHDLDCAQFLGDTLGELLQAVRFVRDGYELGFAIPVVNDAEA